MTSWTIWLKKLSVTLSPMTGLMMSWMRYRRIMPFACKTWAWSDWPSPLTTRFW